MQVTGLEKNNTVVKLIAATLKNLKGFANFEKAGSEQILANGGALSQHEESKNSPKGIPSEKSAHGFNLSYTINLNLPATSDQAVFNAIFRSLKEHLLRDE